MKTKRQLIIRLSPELRRQFHHYAIDKNKSMNAIICEYIETLLKEKKEKGGEKNEK